MSLGRRKKNSTSLTGSRTVRSRESVRRRYPASARITAADSDSAPLFGTATRSMVGVPFVGVGLEPASWRLQMPVDVLELQSPSHHQHLHPVQQLGDLLGERLVALVFGGEPHLPGLLQHLLALGMDAGVQCGDGAGTVGSGGGTLGELGEQGFEGLHGVLLFHRQIPVSRWGHRCCSTSCAPPFRRTGWWWIRTWSRGTCTTKPSGPSTVSPRWSCARAAPRRCRPSSGSASGTAFRWSRAAPAPACRAARTPSPTASSSRSTT